MVQNCLHKLMVFLPITFSWVASSLVTLGSIIGNLDHNYVIHYVVMIQGWAKAWLGGSKVAFESP